MTTQRMWWLGVGAGLMMACASGGGRTASTTTATTTSTSTTQAAIANAVDVVNAPYVASRRSKKFYPAACQTVKLIKPAERVGFSSVRDAEAAGFSKDLYSTDCQY